MDSQLSVKSVKESAVQYLRAHIITGHLPPGHKLNEIELSMQLGISRPPMREAFRLLENEKLVNSIPRKGCFVTPISLENCQENYQAREMTELFAIDIISSKGIRDLTEVAEVTRKAAELTMLEDSDPYQIYEYYKARSAFHIKLVEVADNSILTHFYNTILPNLARYQTLFSYRSSAIEHQRILELIKEGHYEQAKVQLRSHIRTLHSHLKVILQKRDLSS